MSAAADTLQIIGSEFTPASMALREYAARNRLPHHWIDADADADVAALLDGLGVTAADLPIAITQRGVLKRATPGDLAVPARHDRRRAARSAATTSSSSAPARPGWPRRSTPRPRACARSRSTPSRSAARPPPAPASRTTSASRPASPARTSPTRASIQAQKFGAVITSPCAVTLARRRRRAPRRHAVRRHPGRRPGPRRRHRRPLPQAPRRPASSATRWPASTTRRPSSRPGMCAGCAGRRRRRRQLGRPGGDVPRREGLVGVRRRAPTAGGDDVELPRRPHRRPPPRPGPRRARPSPRSHGEPTLRAGHASTRRRQDRSTSTARRCSRSSAPSRTARGSTASPSTSTASCSPTAPSTHDALGDGVVRAGPPPAAATRRAGPACSPSATSGRARPSGSPRPSARARPRSARCTSTSPSPSTPRGPRRRRAELSTTIAAASRGRSGRGRDEWDRRPAGLEQLGPGRVGSRCRNLLGRSHTGPAAAIAPLTRGRSRRDHHWRGRPRTSGRRKAPDARCSPPPRRQATRPP